jgi:hypothetical protein
MTRIHQNSAEGATGPNQEWSQQGNTNKTGEQPSILQKDNQGSREHGKQTAQKHCHPNTRNDTTLLGLRWAPSCAGVLPAVAYTCKASLYTTSFPLTKATLSSRRAPSMNEKGVTSEPAVGEKIPAAARVHRNCSAGCPRRLKEG